LLWNDCEIKFLQYKHNFDARGRNLGTFAGVDRSWKKARKLLTVAISEMRALKVDGWIRECPNFCV